MRLVNYTILIILLSSYSFSSCKGRFYRARSASMENTIMAGEKFYVAHTDSFERNDIVVFDYFGSEYGSSPDENGNFIQHWEKRIFRLIAISGDSLQIKGGDVFVNGKYAALSITGKTSYEVHSIDHIAEFDEMDPSTLSIQKEENYFVYYVSLTNRQAREYAQKKSGIIRVKKQVLDFMTQENFYAKESIEGDWSLDRYGPLRIPMPGEKILIDSVNLKLYHNIPGIQLGENILKEKIYFVMGDNRHAAEDSRFIGFVPHSKVNGIVK